jgi:hypothetical protein
MAGRLKIEGSDEIAAARKRLAGLRNAVAALEKVDVKVPEYLAAEIGKLADEEVEVKIPCLICDRPVRHWIEIDGYVWPRAAVCGPCANVDEDQVV